VIIIINYFITNTLQKKYTIYKMSEKISKITLLKDLPPTVVTAISAAGEIRQFDQDEIIQWQADGSDTFYLLISGSVDLFRLSPAGREQILRRLEAGELFNLVPALIEDSMNPVNVRTLSSCELLAINKKKLYRLMKQFPEFAIRISIYLAQRLRYMTDLVEQLSLHPVRERLAGFLIQQAESPAAGSWTQDEIARRLGTVREVISRTLRDFTNVGIIRMERNRIELLDREKMEKAAKGDE
jgi:CRP-like cAMP-binding protein